jgi:hypothetical protein
VSAAVANVAAWDLMPERLDEEEVRQDEKHVKDTRETIFGIFFQAGRNLGQEQSNSGSMGGLTRRIMDSPIGSRWGERMLLQRTHSSLTACRPFDHDFSARGHWSSARGCQVIASFEV